MSFFIVGSDVVSKLYVLKLSFNRVVLIKDIQFTYFDIFYVSKCE